VTQYVVDASVALKWCLPAEHEEFVLQAEELLASYHRLETKLLVPDLFWIELANVLCQAVRKDKITMEQSTSAMSAMDDLGMHTIPSFDLLPQAMSLAVTHRRTVYDSLYVALAVQSRSEMITADERLANSLPGSLPVKWLGLF
jgi:predicted nucleic acid-binding protein